MAKNMPKSKKKSKVFSKLKFGEIAKALKGKVTFSIDLRKTDSNPSIAKGENRFSFGEKMNLYKAWKEIQTIGGTATFIPIKKKKGESQRQFKQRIRQTRKDFGQGEERHLAGVYIDTPNYANVKQKRIKKAGKWHTEITTESLGKQVALDVGYGREKQIEKFIAIDRAEYDQNPKLYLKNLKKEYKGEWDRILPMHSAYRGNGTTFEKKQFNDFIKTLNKWAFKYSAIEGKDETEIRQKKKKFDSYLTGFVLIKHEIIIPKGSFDAKAKKAGKGKRKAKK